MIRRGKVLSNWRNGRIAGALAIAVISLLTGCGGQASLIGTWRATVDRGYPVSQGYLTCQFFQGGTLNFTGTSVTGGSVSWNYGVLDSSHMKLTTFGGLRQIVATYHLDGDMLTMTVGNQTTEFKRTQ